MNTTNDSNDLADAYDVAAYKAAFLACRAEMSDADLAMLEAHYRASGHTLTAGELAHAVGLRNYSVANLRYGTYAGRLCAVLGCTPEINIAVLVSFGGEGGPGDEFIKWTMLPQVVTALEEMRWVRPASRQGSPSGG